MKIGMIFPGYTSQFVGMGKELYDESRIMQEYFEEASHCLDINFIKLCFASSDVELAKMHHAYTSLFLISSSIYAHMVQLGIEPDVVAGYNVGQYAAFHAAKGITFPDGLYLLSKLTQFIQELEMQEQYALLRIKGCTAEQLKQVILQEQVAAVRIVSFEGPKQHIICGLSEDIDKLMRHLIELPKVKVSSVPLEFGLHTNVLLPAIEQFKPYLEKVDFKDAQVPIIANSSAQAITTGSQLRQEVVDQPQKPILWQQTIDQLHDCHLLLTVGPAKELTKMMYTLYPDKQILNVQKLADIGQIQEIIQQHETEQAQADSVV